MVIRPGMYATRSGRGQGRRARFLCPKRSRQAVHGAASVRWSGARRSPPVGRLGDHHHGRPQQPPVQRPGRRPGLHDRAGRVRRRSPARPSPGAGWGRTAGAGRVLRAGCRCAPACRRSCARRRRSRRAAWRRSPARRRAAGGRLSMPRLRFSAASTTSRGEFLHRVLAGVVDVAAGAGADIGDSPPRRASSGPSCRPVRPRARRCGRPGRPAALRRLPGRGRFPPQRSGKLGPGCSWAIS